MDEQDFAPEEPRGDEPFWFEELRRDSAYEHWLKDSEKPGDDDDAAQHQEHRR